MTEKREESRDEGREESGKVAKFTQESLKRNSLKARLIWGTLAIFLSTELAAVIGNNWLGKPWSLHYSISRHVGFGLWSSMLFALGNFCVAMLVGKYLWKVGEIWRMPRGFYYLVIMMVVGLLGLSFCPLGIADVGGKVSAVSNFHQIFSRMMFLAMLLVALMVTFNQRTNEATRMVCMTFVTYGIICAVGMLWGLEWFEQRILIWETMFFVLFMALMLVLPYGEKVKKRA